MTIKSIIITLGFLFTFAIQAAAQVAIVQSKGSFSSGSSTTSSTQISNVTAGSTLAVVSTYSPSTSVETISGVANVQDGAFTLGTQAIETTSNSAAGTAYFINTAGCSGTNCMTITVTFSGTVSHRGLTVYELSNAPVMAGSNAQGQVNPGSGTDAVSSGTFTTTQAGAIIVAGTQAQQIIGNINIGTNVPGGGTWVARFNGTDDTCGGLRFCHEYALQTAASGSSAGLFNSVSSTQEFATAAIAFEPSGGGGGTPATPKNLLMMGVGGGEELVALSAIVSWRFRRSKHIN